MLISSFEYLVALSTILLIASFRYSSSASAEVAPLLILYFQLGITGAAVATLISQCFGCAMLFG